MEFRCTDDPEANGRIPIKGEQRFSLKFPLEDGSSLVLHMGKEGMNTFAHFIGNMIADDAAEEESRTT